MALPKDAKEAGKLVLEKILQTIPQDQRAGVAAGFASDAALAELGNNALRQEDYSRRMQEVQALDKATEQWRGQLTAWQEQEEAKFAKERERLSKMGATGGGMIDTSGGGGAGAGGQQIDTSKFLTADQAEAIARRRAEERATTAMTYADEVAAVTTRLTLQHFKDYNEVLDTTELMKFCREKNLPLHQGGYEAFTADIRNKKQQEKQDQALKDAEQRGRMLERQENSQLPFVGANSESGPLAGLMDKTRKPASSADSVNAAVATYYEEQRKRTGA